MEKRKIVGIIFVIIGIVFLLSSQMTGAVISTSIGTSTSFIIGITLLIGGIGLILAERGGLERTVYGADVKSFRRHLEKKEKRKISNEDADKLYFAAKNKYYKDKALQNKGNKDKYSLKRPLKYIEELVKSFAPEMKRELSDEEKMKEAYNELSMSGLKKSNIEQIKEFYENNQVNPKNMTKIYKEIVDVLEKYKESNGIGTGYNFHQIKNHSTFGKPINEGDAGILNYLENQHGRGTERYIFDNKTGKLMGVACHIRGDARKYEWKVKF